SLRHVALVGAAAFDCSHSANDVRDPRLRRNLCIDSRWSRHGDNHPFVENLPHDFRQFEFRIGKRLRIHDQLDHIRPGPRLLPAALPERGVRHMRRPARRHAPRRARSRRKALLMLGGVLVALYVLTPFCWLVLTSFMHEPDALTVPPQWIPKDVTF